MSTGDNPIDLRSPRRERTDRNVRGRQSVRDRRRGHARSRRDRNHPYARQGNRNRREQNEIVTW